MSPDDTRHGTPAGYDAHRRDKEPACTPCRAAAALGENRRRLNRMHGITGTVPGLGTARRVQALVAIGWTYRQIGERLGVSHDQPRKWAWAGCTYVRRTKAEAVDRVYRELATTPPPENTAKEKHAAGYARAVARRYGWVTALAWDDIDNDEAPAEAHVPFSQYDARTRDDVDEVVVRRIMTGEWRLPCSKAEKRAVVAAWEGSLSELERRTGWKVERYVDRVDHESEAAA